MTRQDPIDLSTSTKIVSAPSYMDQVREGEAQMHQVRRDIVASARELPFFAEGTRLVQLGLVFASGFVIIAALVSSIFM